MTQFAAGDAHRAQDGRAPRGEPCKSATPLLSTINALAGSHPVPFNVLNLQRFMVSRRLRLILGVLLTLLCSGQALADRQQDPELGKLLQQAIDTDRCFQDKFDQQVWIAAMEPKLRRVMPDEAERAEVLHHVHCEARRLKLPPGLVMAVIDTESRFDRWAVSSAGAVGLMQVMPFWPKQLGMTNAQLVRIPQNVRMGCTILKFYLDRERGDYTRALARYNGSVGRRNYADLVLNRLSSRWHYD